MDPQPRVITGDCTRAIRVTAGANKPAEVLSNAEDEADTHATRHSYPTPGRAIPANGTPRQREVAKNPRNEESDTQALPGGSLATPNPAHTVPEQQRTLQVCTITPRASYTPHTEESTPTLTPRSAYSEDMTDMPHKA